MDDRHHLSHSRDERKHQHRSRSISSSNLKANPSNGASSIHPSSRERRSSQRSSRPPLALSQHARAPESTPGPPGPPRRSMSTGDATPMRDGKTASGFIEEIRHGVMANWLYQNQCTRLWVDNPKVEGVFVRRARGEYDSCPPALVDTRLAQAVNALNLEVSQIALPIVHGCTMHHTWPTTNVV